MGIELLHSQNGSRFVHRQPVILRKNERIQVGSFVAVSIATLSLINKQFAIDNQEFLQVWSWHMASVAMSAITGRTDGLPAVDCFLRGLTSLRKHSVLSPWYICALVCPKTHFLGKSTGRVKPLRT